MLAPQNTPPSIIEGMDGNLTEWFNQVDEALRLSEAIPGQYMYTINSGYANSGEFEEGGSTHVDVACDRFRVISLDNSFISFDITISGISVPAQGTASAPSGRYYYIGYKSAFDAIDQYRIYSNSDLVQTENHANYASYLMYNSLTDQAKANSELYATYDKVQKKSPFVPGVYVSLPTTAAATISVTIPMKIPLNMFMMLTNLKWFLGWMGKLDIEIYPSYKNIVICPILDDTELALVTSTNNKATNIGFTQINEAAISLLSCTATTPTYSAPATQTFTCSNSTTKNTQIRLATYMLNMDVYNTLQAKYVSLPILFPIQTLQMKNFTNTLATTASTGSTHVHTVCLTHCDSMYIVFPETQNSRTCFFNPEITYQVNIDGHMYPIETYNTYEDRKSINMTYDSFNVNNNPLFSVSDDFANSLQPYHVEYVYVAAGTSYSTTLKYCITTDHSNFMIGIPFSTDEDFQGGISSGSTIQVELMATRGSSSHKLIATTYTPIGLYLEDAILKIRAVKPAGEAQIKITNASVEEILAGRASV